MKLQSSLICLFLLLLASCSDAIEEPQTSDPANVVVNNAQAVEEMVKADLIKINNNLILNKEALTNVGDKFMTWEEFDQKVAGKWWWRNSGLTDNPAFGVPIYFPADRNTIVCCSRIATTRQQAHPWFRVHYPYKRMGDVVGFAFGLCPLYINQKGELEAIYIYWSSRPQYIRCTFRELTAKETEEWEQKTNNPLSYGIATACIDGQPIVVAPDTPTSRAEYDGVKNPLPSTTSYITQTFYKENLLGTAWKPVEYYDVASDGSLTKSESKGTNTILGALGEILCLDFKINSSFHTYRKNEHVNYYNACYEENPQIFTMPDPDNGEPIKYIGFGDGEWAITEYLGSDLLPMKVADGKLYVLRYDYNPWVEYKLLVCEPMSSEELVELRRLTCKDFYGWCFYTKFFD